LKINDTKMKLAAATVVSLLTVLLVTSNIFAHNVEAKVSKKRPGYEIPFNSKGDHRLLAIVKFQDPNGKNNNCWDEIYARATPKNNNHDVLNKQTIENNDTPSNGPSEIIRLTWNFKEATIKKTSTTNDGKIRYYVEIELVGGIVGETVTKYKTFDAGTRDLDFGVFLMHTNPDLCK
jgi:hypothetical protein